MNNLKDIIRRQIKTPIWAFVETYNEAGFPIDHDVTLFINKEDALKFAREEIRTRKETNFSIDRTVNFEKYHEAHLLNKYAKEEGYKYSVMELKQVITKVVMKGDK